jgi:hypothetical protein
MAAKCECMNIVPVHFSLVCTVLYVYKLESVILFFSSFVLVYQ